MTCADRRCDLTFTKSLGTASARAAAALMLRGAVLASLALVAACAPINTKVPVLPDDAPTTWQKGAAAAAGKSGLLQPDLQNWWHAFDDTTLDRLIERALHD
ncbi:MAG: hypothetical protein ACREPT_12380, partial [Rudaea sp.]